MKHFLTLMMAAMAICVSLFAAGCGGGGSLNTADYLQAGEIRLYWPDGTEVDKTSAGVYHILQPSQTEMVKMTVVDADRSPLRINVKNPGGSGTVIWSQDWNHHQTWIKWEGNYEFWLSDDVTGQESRRTILHVGSLSDLPE